MLQLPNLENYNIAGFETISNQQINEFGFPKTIAEFLNGLKEMVLF
jgi:hypothetical protein